MILWHNGGSDWTIKSAKAFRVAATDTTTRKARTGSDHTAPGAVTSCTGSDGGRHEQPPV